MGYYSNNLVRENGLKWDGGSEEKGWFSRWFGWNIKKISDLYGLGCKKMGEVKGEY